MFLRRRKVVPLFLVALCIMLLSACSGTSNTTSQPSQAPTSGSSNTQVPASGGSNAQAVAPIDKTQSGDIPDTQAFVSYPSPKGGYTLDVPEGWARTETPTDVSFVDLFGFEWDTFSARGGWNSHSFSTRLRILKLRKQQKLPQRLIQPIDHVTMVSWAHSNTMCQNQKRLCY